MARNLPHAEALANQALGAVMGAEMRLSPVEGFPKRRPMNQFDENRVIACLHDVSPRHFERVVEIDEFYARIGVGTKYAMLVVPNFWGEWSLEDHPEFARWLRGRAEAGVEMFLHGYFHKNTVPEADRSMRLRAQYALLGEGEFADLDEEEALGRLKSGKAMVEDLLGAPVTFFVAPAWQYSDGARRALKALGFEIAENRASVWSPATGETLTKTPVVAYSARSAVRRDLSIGWSRAASHVLRGARVVRHALHPNDFNDATLTREIERSLSELVAERKLTAYRELLAA